MAFTETNDVTKPAGSRARSLGDDDIREFKRLEIERQAVDHDRRDIEGSDPEKDVIPDATGGAAIGYHKKATLIVRGSNPTAVANAIIVFSKDVGGKAELHTIDEDGNVKQITTAGKLNIAATEAVLLSGDQTIAGVKTFSSAPVLSAGATLGDDLNFAQKEAVGMAIETRTDDPGSPVAGQMWLRTD